MILTRSISMLLCSTGALALLASSHALAAPTPIILHAPADFTVRPTAATTQVTYDVSAFSSASCSLPGGVNVVTNQYGFPLNECLLPCVSPDLEFTVVQQDLRNYLQTGIPPPGMDVALVESVAASPQLVSSVLTYPLPERNCLTPSFSLKL
jgi:hypothetical protein